MPNTIRAIVVTAALLNAAEVTGRELPDMRVVISGAGAAGIAVSNMLLETGIGVYLRGLGLIPPDA